MLEKKKNSVGKKLTKTHVAGFCRDATETMMQIFGVKAGERAGVTLALL